MSETEVTTEVQVDDTDNLDTFSDDFFGRKPAEPADTTTAEVEQEPETEVTEAQPDPNEDPEAEYVETPKKKPTVQDRIDELVKQREDAKREAAQELIKVRKEFEEKLAALTPKVAPKVEQAAEPNPLDTLEDGTEKYPLGEFDPQYIKDLTRFTLNAEHARFEKEAAEQRKVQEEQSARDSLFKEWNSKVEEATDTSYPDFVDKVRPMLDSFGDLRPNYAQYLSTTIMSMDKGTDVLYYLSSHPEEATKIVNSGAQKATLALGRIEAKFLEADAQKVIAKPKISNAPMPPIARARGTNGAFISVAPDTDDLDAFSTLLFDKKRVGR